MRVGAKELYIRKFMEVNINFSEIIDWETFHKVFSTQMGFQEFYGRNMDAWIDCMSSIDLPEEKMSFVSVKKNESLYLIVSELDKAFKVCPHIIQEFLECIAIVNNRFINRNSLTKINVIAI